MKATIALHPHQLLAAIVQLEAAKEELNSLSIQSIAVHRIETALDCLQKAIATKSNRKELLSFIDKFNAVRKPAKN